jgi:hypothetical protein
VTKRAAAKPKKLPKPEWLDRSGFTMPVYYTLVTTQAMMDQETKRLGAKHYVQINNGSGATTHFLECESNDNKCAIVSIDHAKNVERGRSGIVIAAMLCHEAMHIAQEVFDMVGEKYPSSEFEAYLVQRISLELMSEYARQVFGTGADGVHGAPQAWKHMSPTG